MPKEPAKSPVDKSLEINLDATKSKSLVEDDPEPPTPAATTPHAQRFNLAGAHSNVDYQGLQVRHIHSSDTVLK